tara:strand:- start:1269 stop:1652 length:384 start_codon:yes stop_codon:yes gene_type:complete
MQAAYLNQISDNFGDIGLRVLGVNINSPSIINQVRPWTNKRKINFDISLDPSKKLADQFNVRGLPTLFLIDKNGTILKEFSGFTNGYEEDYLKEIKKYLDSENISYGNFEFEKHNKTRKDVSIDIDF